MSGCRLWVPFVRVIYRCCVWGWCSVWGHLYKSRCRVWETRVGVVCGGHECMSCVGVVCGCQYTVFENGT